METAYVIVIESAGDSTKMQYLPAALPLAKKQIKLFVTDTKLMPYAFWQGEPPSQYFEVPKELTFLCKTRARDWEIWRRLAARAVFVVTPDEYHCKVASAWLNRADLIIVDKCFAPRTEHVKKWLRSTDARVKAKVRGFDHYWMRALPMRYHLNRIVDEIGGEIEHIEFRMLEPRLVEPHRDLPGLIQDFGSHLLALLGLIGDLDNLRDIEAWGAMYKGANLTYGNETFGKIGFAFRSPYGPRTKGSALVGKAIGHAVETFLDLKGPGGARMARVDLRGGDPQRDRRDITILERRRQEYVACRRIASLPYIKPHEEMFSRVARWSPDMEECFFDVNMGCMVAEKIEETYERLREAHGFSISESPQHPNEEIRKRLPEYQPGDSWQQVLGKVARNPGVVLGGAADP